MSFDMWKEVSYDKWRWPILINYHIENEDDKKKNIHLLKISIMVPFAKHLTYQYNLLYLLMFPYVNN
jgi:hypothetical protein